MDNEAMAKKLSSSYAIYLKVNNQKEMNMLDESIEETLTRLEELENGIQSLQEKREKGEPCDFTVARSSLNALCQRVHKLDEMTKKVFSEVDELEKVVSQAEGNLLKSPEGSIKNVFKPFFSSMRSSDVSAPPQDSSSNLNFTPQPHFSSSSLFNRTSDDSFNANSTFDTTNDTTFEM